VVNVPALPTIGFVAIVAGGLWVLLWRQRWRLWGIVPIIAGIALAPTTARPDILVGRDGITVAVRAPDGRLSALASRGSAFELARWIDRDGERRAGTESADPRAFTCDALACSARVRGLTIAVVASPGSLRDDCRRADVLIIRHAQARPCLAPRAGQIVIDGRHLASAGAHAIFITASGPRIETVAEARGVRPWSNAVVARAPPPDGAEPPAVAYRIGGFAALFDRFRPPRPEQVERIWPRPPPAD
jgi:competence protein ComEC